MSPRWGLVILPFLPRALPWAGLCQAFGHLLTQPLQFRPDWSSETSSPTPHLPPPAPISCLIELRKNHPRPASLRSRTNQRSAPSIQTPILTTRLTKVFQVCGRMGQCSEGGTGSFILICARQLPVRYTPAVQSTRRFVQEDACDFSDMSPTQVSLTML